MFIVIPLLALLVSCNIFVPKECEQLSDMIGDIPALNKNDYNDCELVNQNYMYFAKWQDDSIWSIIQKPTNIFHKKVIPS